MNPSLNALTTKLNWQLNELHLHLQEAQNQAQAVMQQMQKIDEQIGHAKLNSLLINPDLEINRLNFVMQQQEKKEILAAQMKSHQDLEHKLEEKIQRLKTELKMLEKYMAREELIQKEQQNKAQDNAMDEWVIQKKELL